MDTLDPKLKSALCYAPIIGWLASIVLLLVDKDQTVRFNAAQGLALSVVIFLASVLLFVVGPLVWLGAFILQIYLTVRAYQGEKVTLPVLSDLAEKALGKMTVKK